MLTRGKAPLNETIAKEGHNTITIKRGSGKMAQQVKALAGKPHDLNSIPKTQKMEGGH